MTPLFANEHLLAVDKPGGWLSVPSRMGSQDPRPVLGLALEKETGQRLWPVHRLDEEVTGVILFAKTAEAHRIANKWFEERRVEKTYEAWSEPTGAALPAVGEDVTWEATLLRGKKRAYEGPHGKPSVTRARREADVGGAYAWTLQPHTGRPHQLRWELHRHGTPILGDALYGAKTPFRDGTIALRCVRLRFTDEPGAAALGLPPVLEAPGLKAWVNA